MGVRRVPIEETLSELGVGDEALDSARTLAKRQGIPVRDAAIQVEGVDHGAVAQALSNLSGLPVLAEIDGDAIPNELVHLMPISVSRGSGLMPLYESRGQLVVAVSNLGALDRLPDLRILYGKPLRPVIVRADKLDKAMQKAYERASRDASAVLDAVDDEMDEFESDLNIDAADIADDPNQAPIIRFVNAVLTQAVKEGASDIHIEPFEKDLIVRFRVDGVLREAVRPPGGLKNSIVARIKIMAGLNIAEKRLPQDGRIQRRMGGREIDLRVSTLPVRHGERVVMRILEKGEVFSLDASGMEDDVLDVWRKLIRRPHGILLVSGPTGSGKTTTLYSALAEINSPDLNILTIEDPVEYELKGIGQTQVHSKINLTFASALRAHLRQDPDVIMVGEIRDRETAENAVRASLTGHLVFSTIHTNDAAGAFGRLIDMGVEPYLVAGSLLGVLAQRLVRRLCSECCESYIPTDVELADLELNREKVPGSVFRAVGCEVCNGRGYKGRAGIYEFLKASEGIKTLVQGHADAGKIKRQAMSDGMRTLREDGVEKVLAGVTTFEEVIRVTSIEQADEE
ncbi:MAG: type II secretion system ATPase GspE [Proteobacteria bacterium]|nr:type II secretion system ATPase GspE [Pseudomonadota bacterium]